MRKLAEIWKTATLFEKLTLFLSAFYVLSPLDIIPEVVLGPFGIFDDATAIGVFIWTLRSIIKRIGEKERSEMSETSELPTPLHRSSALDAKR